MHNHSSFSCKKTAKIRQLFNKIDLDSKGYITRQELQLHIDTCWEFQDKEGTVEAILESCDIDQDGCIDFQQFRQILLSAQNQRQPPPTKEQLLFAFDLFDADGNHLISFKEFFRQVKKLDGSITKKQAEAMFSDIDQDRDGCIDFREFSRYLGFDFK